MKTPKMQLDKEPVAQVLTAKEEETLNQILKVEKEFRDYYACLLKEMAHQMGLIERMWYLSQRYVISISSGPCCQLSEVYSSPPADVILQEYYDKMQIVRTSNCQLWQRLRDLRFSYRHFQKLCSELDMSRESPLIVGDTFHKPISYFIELIDDIFKYFHSLLLSFGVQAHQMDPGDPLQLEEYKKILEPSEDFEEYFLQGLVYCKCLQPKRNCEAKPPSKMGVNFRDL